jgi:hypothetical protein
MSAQKLKNSFGLSRKVDKLSKCLLEINVIIVGTFPWILHRTEHVFIINFNGYCHDWQWG